MKTIDNAQLKLQPSFLASLEDGETVAVIENHTLLAFVVPALPPTSKRPNGLAKGEFKVPSDFNDPLPDLETAIYES